ncbi:AEC family transporter [Neobacillus drentensis]|uniref:AEC family transporter n=1 Tax=Neobacillus drentensis TaxID=220684 RepID=UPI00286CBC88|nr:AEC family transporter [Neobacillus drentensis]
MLWAVFNTLYQVFLPISFPVIAGWLLGKFQKLETRPLLTLTLYLLSPALIFNVITKSRIESADVMQTLAFCIINFFFLWLIANLWGRLLKMSSPDLAGLTLVSTFTNSVNYGLPLVLLAFGQAGMDYATVYVIIQMIIVNVVGVYLAARSHFSINQAIKSIVKLPAIYAAVAAILVQMMNFQVPAGIDKGISLIAASFSPIVLCILGAQMANVRNDGLARSHQKAFWSGISIRLFISPLIAFFILWMLNIKGTQLLVMLILASMPAAVNAVVLAEKFDASPKFVSKCILWTTLASLIILPFFIVASGVG